MLRNVCVDGLKNNVWHDTCTSSVGKNIADICRLRSTKLIFVGYGQLNATIVFDFFAPGMYETSYLNMQHLGAVNKQIVIVVFPDYTDLHFTILNNRNVVHFTCVFV